MTAFSAVMTPQPSGTAESLYNQLAYRGYSWIDYGTALTELAQHGFVAANVSQTYQITSPCLCLSKAKI